ncbi:MAG: sigma factor [Bacteroidota bacterium]
MILTVLLFGGILLVAICPKDEIRNNWQKLANGDRDKPLQEIYKCFYLAIFYQAKTKRLRKDLAITAEDLTQDVFLNLANPKRTLNAEVGNVLAYLSRILDNNIKNHLKAQSKRPLSADAEQGKQQLKDWKFEEELKQFAIRYSFLNEAGEAVFTDDGQHMITSIIKIADLTPNQAMVFSAGLLGYSHKEKADRLSLSYQSIKTHSSAARKKILEQKKEIRTFLNDSGFLS